ncbi:hypothetical protein BC835DRAFT_1461661 [Cytidiella melzeri]|nr:hypothetical protein BC835DRAFT_1461661 [Cytidiella melzeri]
MSSSHLYDAAWSWWLKFSKLMGVSLSYLLKCIVGNHISQRYTTMSGQDAKEKGNAAFKSGDFIGAIGHYTVAMFADPKNATYPLNRAAAYLKLGKNEDADRDCTRVIELDGKNVKGWFRRGQARAALARLDDAKKDFERVLQLEPQNSAAQQEVKKVTQAIQERDFKLKKKAAPRGISTPVPSSSTAVPRRRRVPITIIDTDESSSHSPTFKDASPAPVEKDFLQAVSTRPLDGAKASSSAIPTTSNVKKSTTFKEAKQAREAQQTRPGGGIFRRDGQHTLFDTRSTTSSAPPLKHDDSPSTNAEATSPLLTPPPNTASAKPPPAPFVTNGFPMTLVNFNRNWDLLRTPEARWDFFQQLPPTSLPSLFKTSLEPSNLVSMLKTFQHVLQSPSASLDTKMCIQEYLVNLARVSRFGTLMLFMSADERRLVKDVWDALRNDEASDVQERRAWGLF